MKTCSKCHTEKPMTDFRFIRKNKNGTDLYRAKCNDCYNGHYIEKYRQKDDEERKEIYNDNISYRTAGLSSLLKSLGLHPRQLSEAYQVGQRQANKIRDQAQKRLYYKMPSDWAGWVGNKRLHDRSSYC